MLCKTYIILMRFIKLACIIMLFVNCSLLQPSTTLRRCVTQLFVHFLSKLNFILKACSWREALSGPQEQHGARPAFLREQQAAPPPPQHLPCLACSQSSWQPGLSQDPLLPIRHTVLVAGWGTALAIVSP